MATKKSAVLWPTWATGGSSGSSTGGGIDGGANAPSSPPTDPTKPALYFQTTGERLHAWNSVLQAWSVLIGCIMLFASVARAQPILRNYFTTNSAPNRFGTLYVSDVVSTNPLGVASGGTGQTSFGQAGQVLVSTGSGMAWAWPSNTFAYSAPSTNTPPATNAPSGDTNFPSGLASLVVADWDANSLGAVGSAVSAWTDSVGGVVASQATGVLQPTVTNTPSGHKAAYFDGNDYLTHTLSRAGAQSIALVLRHEVSSDPWNCPFIASTSGTGPALIVMAKNYNTTFAGTILSGFVNSTFDLRNTNAVLIATMDGLAGPTTNRFWLNGSVQALTDSSTQPAQAFDRRYIGNYDVTNGGLFKGWIARIIVFNTALDASQVATLRAYLDTL